MKNFTQLLAQVCDVMFPAGARSLEQLTRGLMNMLFDFYLKGFTNREKAIKALCGR